MIPYISAENVMTVMDRVDSNEKLFFKAQDDLLNDHRAISAIISDENLDLLSDDEYDLLWFVLVTCYLCIKEKGEIAAIEVKKLEEIEENNWSIMEQNPSLPWKSRLDPFFDGYPQEDLLAFVEDSFESDEDLQISGPVREVLFVTAKSCLDALLDL
jgi:hypothetical protein